MRRMPFVLESRHRLLYLRASLESEASRGASQCTLDLSQFEIMSLRRDDLMAIDMGKLKNKETVILPII